MALFSTIKQKFEDTIFVYQYNQVVRYVCSFLISVLMVKSALPAVNLGEYEIFIFIAASVSAFWSAGIKNAMFSFYPKLGEREKEQFFPLVFYALIGLSLFVAGGIHFFPTLIIKIFSFQEGIPYLPYLAMFLIFSIPVTLVESIFYLKNDAQRLLNYTHWSQLLTILLVAAVSFYAPDLWSFIYSLILINLIRFLFLIYIVFSKHPYDFNWNKTRLFLLFSLPLIVTMLLGYAMDFVDGWFVSYYFDATYFPVYKYGARELPLSSILFSTLSIAMVPVIIKQGKHTNEIKLRATKLMHWLFPISALLMILSPLFFPLFYNENYKESAFIFNIYLLILISRVLLPQAFCMAFNQFSIIIWTSVFEILVNIILSYWWMQVWGVYGLALATVIAYIFQKVVLIFYNFWKNKISIDQYIDLRYYLIYTSTLVIVFIATFKYL